MLLSKTSTTKFQFDPESVGSEEPQCKFSYRFRQDLKDSPVSFNCYATGQPAPTIRWERVGKEQVPQGSSGALTIASWQV